MTKKSDTPAIRFKGFTDTWEQRKLGEVGETYTGLSGKSKDDFGHGSGKFITYMNVFSNPVASSNMTEAIEIDDSQNKVQFGDVLFTTSSETPDEVGMSSVWLENAENTYLNSFCFGYRPTTEYNPYYLAYMLRSSSMRKKITFLAQGISRYNISKNKMMDIEMPIPSIDEQKQIGEYFRNLDNLITLHQRKYDKLTNVKKSMLEKMFPKNGSNVPEIRFKGFTEAWEQRKLGECTDLLTGHPFESKQFSENGVLLIRGMNVKRNELDTSPEICEYWHTTEGLEKYLLSADDILIQMDGALIGKSYAKMPKNKLPALLVQRVTRARTKNDYDNDFIYQSLQRDFLTYIQGIKTETAVPHLSLNDIFIFKIYVPSLAEQKKIGSCFRNLDNLITLHQRELEKLKNIKKSCLENMFV